MKQLAINNFEKERDVIFYFEEEYNCVVAYFPTEFLATFNGRNVWINSFVLQDGFGGCNKEYIQHFRPATKAEYLPTLESLKNYHGFNLNIIE